MRKLLALLMLALAAPAAAQQVDTTTAKPLTLKQIRQILTYSIARAENTRDELDAELQHLRNAIVALTAHINGAPVDTLPAPPDTTQAPPPPDSTAPVVIADTRTLLDSATVSVRVTVTRDDQPIAGDMLHVGVAGNTGRITAARVTDTDIATDANGNVFFEWHLMPGENRVAVNSSLRQAPHVLTDTLVVGAPPVDTTTPSIPPPAPPGSGDTALVALVEEIIGPVGMPQGALWDSLYAVSLFWAEHQWNNWRANPFHIASFDYYDVAAIFYYLGALSGDQKWAARADTIAGEYCAAYACTGSQLAPRNWQPRGMEIYWRRTGNPAALAAIRLHAEKLRGQLDCTASFSYCINGPNVNMDSRQVARSLLSVVAGVRSAGLTAIEPVIIGEAVPRLEAMQLAHPTRARWIYNRPVNENAIFHGMLVVHALGDAQRRGYVDSRIDGMVDRFLDDAWTFARPTATCQGRVRTTLPYDYSGNTPQCYHHTMNGIYIVPFAQRYARTLDPAHLQQVTDLLAGALASETWDNRGKEYAEVARTIWAAGLVASVQGN